MTNLSFFFFSWYPFLKRLSHLLSGNTFDISSVMFVRLYVLWLSSGAYRLLEESLHNLGNKKPDDDTFLVKRNVSSIKELAFTTVNRFVDSIRLCILVTLTVRRCCFKVIHLQTDLRLPPALRGEHVAGKQPVKTEASIIIFGCCCLGRDQSKSEWP